MSPLAASVIERMRNAVGVDTDKELAERLDVKPSTPSNWRSRNKLPLEECLHLATEQGLSLDWLVFGEGHSARGVDQGDAHPGDAELPGHRALERLRGYDTTPGPDRLVVPELLLRARGVDDAIPLRWMVNPGSGLAPRLPKGGLLLVDARVMTHDAIEDGETYVVRFAGRIIVRRIFVLGPNEYRLRGDRERDDRRDLTGKDYEHLEIGGKVVDVL